MFSFVFGGPGGGFGGPGGGFLGSSKSSGKATTEAIKTKATTRTTKTTTRTTESTTRTQVQSTQVQFSDPRGQNYTLTEDGTSESEDLAEEEKSVTDFWALAQHVGMLVREALRLSAHYVGKEVLRIDALRIRLVSLGYL